MTEITARSDDILIVVDAQCALCGGGARWIAHRDNDQRFRIVPMQSALGRHLFRQHGIDPDDPASWLYLEDGKPLTGMEAWARVGQVIGGLARLLTLLLLIPRPLRDRLYSFVARNRIRFFGRDDLCRMPDPAIAQRLMQ